MPCSIHLSHWSILECDYIIIRSGQNGPRIEETAQVSNFKVQVRAGGVTGGTGIPDHLTLVNPGATGDIDHAQVA